MHLSIPLISRFFAARRQDAGNTLPAAFEDINTKPDATGVSGVPCNDSPKGNDVVEIPDSEEESDWDPTDWEAIDGPSNTSIPAQLSGGSPVDMYPLTCNVSLSTLYDHSDNRVLAVSDSLNILPNEDSNANPGQLLTSTTTYGTSIGAWKNILSDPRSSIWEGRKGARLAVVVLQESNKAKEMLDKEFVLRELSSSEQNVVAERKGRASSRDSMSNGRRKDASCYHGGGFAFLVRYLFVPANTAGAWF
ncbi:hypothetical protein N431DRAFT_452261 [Stipitochalara longipes BDJ]|nr:hypothetical protein N431DRAFT_452261 [Stipitochalara longipes BDJ]